MAILWQKTVAGKHYQVRAAGNSRRLYTDGVFHSQYNAINPLTGGVWDLLMLPAFFYPPGRIRRVLVLGVGGGAVIQQLRHYVWPERIVGVEMNPVHLYVARRFFQLRQPEVRLHRSEAVEWLRAYNGEPFDMIIDDLFGEKDGEPVRAVALNAVWFDALLKRLSPKGMLVVNFISPKELRRCAYFSNRRIAARFAAAYKITNRLEENAVGVFLREASTPRRLAKNLQAIPRLARAWRSGRLDAGIRRLRAAPEKQFLAASL